MTNDRKRQEEIEKLIKDLGCEHGELGAYLNTMVNDILPPTSRHGEYLRKLFRKYDEFVADFIIQDRNRIMDEIVKHIEAFEVHDGIKDDYVYMDEIGNLLSTIHRLRGEMK